jgi:Protein of unknown function (DUF2786)
MGKINGRQIGDHLVKKKKVQLWSPRRRTFHSRARANAGLPFKESVMTINRESLIEKIRALLSKTIENGCTECEALAALDKARAMMDAYEVTEADLQLTAAESAIIRSEPPGSRDAHGIKTSMAVAVCKFCDCEVRKASTGLVFCGLPADVDLATWLLDKQAAFVQAQLAGHLMGCIAPKGERRRHINGFVVGCCHRINDRLTALCAQSAAVATSNGRELVAIKSAAIADKMKAMNISLRKGRRSSRRIDDASYQAGLSAGDRASFGRPVRGPNAALRIK